MKILPITNNTPQKQISSKGGVSMKFEMMVNNMARARQRNAMNSQTNNEPALSKLYQQGASGILNALDNIKTIMLQFTINSVFVSKQSKTKPEIHRFYIEDAKSNYKYVVGDFNITEKYNDAVAIKKLSETMKKINPYEVNLKLRLGAKQGFNSPDYFIPEKEFDFIEDNLKELYTSI